MKCAVKTLDNKDAGEIDLADDVFATPVRQDLLARVVRWQLAKRRSGNHKTKGRSEVAGTTAKAYKQKGTGRARRGNLKSNIMVGGGVVFGPVVRDHGFSLPKKVRKLGLKTALSAKFAEGKLLVLDSLELKTPKTADLAKRFGKMGLGNALFIGGAAIDEDFRRAAANLQGIDVLPVQGANVYDIMRRETLVLTRQAVEGLEARLK